MRDLFGMAVSALVAAIAATVASGAVTIERRSSPILYFDAAPAGGGLTIVGMYVAYDVTNGGSAIESAYVTIGSSSGPSITAAPSEPGFFRLQGALAKNQTRTVYFYLVTSGATAGPETHTVSVFGGVPSALFTSRSFSMTAAPTIASMANGIGTFTVVPSHPTLGDTGKIIVTGTTGTTPAGGTLSAETFPAQANGIDVVVTVPNPLFIGAEATITVDGHTGTIGPSRVLSFTPAALASWPAAAMQMTSSSISLPGFAHTPYDDLLLIPPDDAAGVDTAYTATYRFTLVALSSAPSVPVAPIAVISSGLGEKHADTSGFGVFSLPLP
jgi:hypothetical protein